MSVNEQFSVSVVIPAYNAEMHIRRSIDSVLGQTRMPHEIIVVDDGSTDKTQTLLSEYGDKIINIHQENAGASIARNTGIKRASGSWIAFLDVDDEWLPSLIEMQVEKLLENPHVVWSYSNYWFMQHDSGHKRIAFRPSPPLKNNVIQDYLTVHSKYNIRTSACIIKKSVLCDSGLFMPEQKWVQDTDLFLRIAYKHPQIVYIDTPLANYYSETPQSLTSKHCFLAEELCSLVERHLILSQENNRQKELIRSMSKKIPYWVNVAIQHENYKEARTMIKRMGHLVPIRTRWNLTIQIYLSIFKKLWSR